MSELKFLSEVECYEILSKSINVAEGSNLKVIDYKIAPACDDAVGFLGDYFQVDIKYEINNEQRKKLYFIKSLPHNDIPRRNHIEEIGVFAKEVDLYKILLPEIKNVYKSTWHPECYFSRPDIIVLEHLVAAGYKHLPGRVLFSMDHMKIALTSLADMHASSIILETKAKINIGEKYGNILFDPSIVKENGWWNAGLNGIKTIAEVHPKYQTSDYQKYISERLIKSFDRIYNLTKSSTNFRNVLCHRDTWSKNMFFKYNDEDTNSLSKPEKCVFVDFQICRYHTPSLDVMLIIYLNSNRQQRNAHMEELLRFYYDYLINLVTKEGGTVTNDLSWNEFRKNCDIIKLIPLTLSAIYAPCTYLPDGYMNELKRTDQKMFNECMDGNRNQLILKMIKEDELYKNLVFEVVEELVDYVYNVE